MIDPITVGRCTPPTFHEVERGAIRRFAESLGDATPASLVGEPLVAPPTFPVSLSAGVDFAALLGISGSRLLLSELCLEYERPIAAGDRLLVASRVLDVSERSTPAGRIDVAVVEDEGCDEAGTLVYRARRTFVVRPARER